jgi:hypothetical protein
MIIHVPGRDLIIKAGLLHIFWWHRIAAAAINHWDHGYITVYGLVVKRW